MAAVSKATKAAIRHAELLMGASTSLGEVLSIYRETYKAMRNGPEREALLMVYREQERRFPLPSQRRVWRVFHGPTGRNVTVMRANRADAAVAGAAVLGESTDLEVKPCVAGSGSDVGAHMEYVTLNGSERRWRCAFCGGLDLDTVDEDERGDETKPQPTEQP